MNFILITAGLIKITEVLYDLYNQSAQTKYYYEIKTNMQIAENPHEITDETSEIPDEIIELCIPTHEIDYSNEKELDYDIDAINYQIFNDYEPDSYFVI